MREIDLIPASYRAARRQTLWLKVLAGFVLGLVATTGAARLWLDVSIAAIDSEVASLQARQTITTAERDRLATLNETKRNYEEQLYLLNGLRSGAATTDLFAIIDDALIDREVWFRSWEFRRAGVTNAQGQSIETGYFVVVADNAVNADSWRVETHMTVAGQALDHAALSRFVQRLLEHPEIENVHIRRTELQRFAVRSLVDFDLAVVINRQVQN
jgi:hypothetical protein